MAMNIVPQAGISCKPFEATAKFFTGYSRLDSDPNDYRISGSLRQVLVKQIMNGSNEQALATLSSVGQVGFVPGIGNNSIPLNEFASFYGVSEKYLKGLLIRSRFIQSLYPDDISRTYLSDIIAANAPITINYTSVKDCGGDLVKYHITGSYTQLSVSLPRSGLFSLYSPRMVLATALMMVYTDKSDQDGNIKNTLLAIKRSPYRFIQPEPANSQKENEPTAANKPKDGNDMKNYEDVTFSPAIITYAVKAAVDSISDSLTASIVASVKTAVLEAMIEAGKNNQLVCSEVAEQASRRGVQAKLKKPDNWDAIVTLWKAGNLNADVAAQMAGMSVSSFRNYANGRKNFD